MTAMPPTAVAVRKGRVCVQRTQADRVPRSKVNCDFGLVVRLGTSGGQGSLRLVSDQHRQVPARSDDLPPFTRESPLTLSMDAPIRGLIDHPGQIQSDNRLSCRHRPAEETPDA